MDTVNYQASTSKYEEIQEPSVDIIDSKSNRSSYNSTDDRCSLNSDEQNLSLKNRPSDALWTQQKLAAWQPIFTADSVLPAFFLLGIACIPIGIGLLITSNSVQEFEINYTDCFDYRDKQETRCADLIKPNSYQKCICKLNFTLKTEILAPVYFYYGISGFYQNHRRYVQSRDDSQLAGNPKTVDQLSSKCYPYSESSHGKPIAPCGAIANSLFNDSFKLNLANSGSDEPINLVTTDIAWPTDVEYKFSNPSEMGGKYDPPPYWRQSIEQLPNGFKNEHFIIWMRTSAFPSFRKLWARIDHEQNPKWSKSLDVGNYMLEVEYNYPVSNFDGEKRIVISNTSWFGGKNNFLGIAYITFGGACLVLWVVFIFIVHKYSRNPKDVVDIGPQTQYYMAQ